MFSVPKNRLSETFFIVKMIKNYVLQVNQKSDYDYDDDDDYSQRTLNLRDLTVNDISLSS